MYVIELPGMNIIMCYMESGIDIMAIIRLGQVCVMTSF